MFDQSRDDIIAAIYAAAVEPDGLAVMANALRSYFAVDSAGVWLIDRGTIRDVSQTDDIVASIEPYLQYYQALDPWKSARKRPGHVYLSCDDVDEAALVESEFYRDFARHYGMLRPMGLVVDLGQDRLGTFALNRISGSGLLDEVERARLQDLTTHLRAALLLRARLGAEQALGGARAAALDAFSFGVVVCSADAAVWSVNRAACALAEAGAGILLGGRHGILSARTPNDTRSLHALIRAAVDGRPGAMRLSGAGFARLSVLVTPLRPEQGLIHVDRTMALVCLSRDDAPAGVDAPTLMRLFGLSPAQAGLCIPLLAGLTFEEAAMSRGIATSTARSHFLAILAKTGARNLRDLLRLLGSLPAVSPWEAE